MMLDFFLFPPEFLQNYGLIFSQLLNAMIFLENNCREYLHRFKILSMFANTYKMCLYDC